MDNFPVETKNVKVKGKAKSGKLKVVKYDRSFLSRLIQSQKSKEFYNDIKNYCLSFEKAKARPSWGAESFAVGNETPVKLIMVGDALCACFGLNPKDYDPKKFPHKDLSEDKEFETTPMFVPIRTAAEYKIARRLAADAFTARCVYTVDFPTRKNYLKDLETRADTALIKKGLIKTTESEMSESDLKKAVAASLRAEAEEEALLEGIGVKPKKEKKPAPAPAPEPVVEESVPEETPVPVAAEPKGPFFEVRYDRSFSARIIQSDRAKTYYSEIKNYALSFGLKPRLSWRADSLYLGRKTYLLVKVCGKTLYLYFALDPKAHEEKIYHHKDVSDRKTYEKNPFRLRIRSDTWLRKAKRLIALMMTEAGRVEKEIEQVDYAALYPYETTEALLDKKLIKKIVREVPEGATPFVRTTADPDDVEIEDVDFELAEEPEDEAESVPAEKEDEIEDVEFELVETEPVPEPSAQEDEIEDVEFELAEEPATAAAEEDDAEDVSFELAEEESPVEDEAGAMESYGKEGTAGKFVTLRKYMRGFTAKMRQGDQDRKDYYAEIKSRLLSLKGVKVSESFSGDSFKKGAKQLLKSRIRGKTLCLFFALDTDQYKQTIYRQQYKGDVKAYAATPMMVRVKSEQGLKRAIRLVEELVRNYTLEEGAPVSVNDVRKTYLYEETPSLVEQGLIKVRLVKVSEYEAEELLRKHAK